MKIDIGWILFGLVVFIAASIPMALKEGAYYDKRNWACAEYEANQRTNVPECVRLERAVNK